MGYHNQEQQSHRRTMIVFVLLPLGILAVSAQDVPVEGPHHLEDSLDKRDGRAARDPGDIITLHHGSAQKTTERKLLDPYPYFLDPGVTVLSTNSFPTEPRYRPTIGNGHVATVIKNDGIFMNGLYNGLNTTSHRARIPSLLIADIEPLDVTSCTGNCAGQKKAYGLDVGNGMFIESHKAQGYEIELKQYAHRTIQQLLVTELRVKNSQNEALKLNLTINKGSASEDIDFSERKEGDILIQNGITKIAEYEISGLLNVSVISTDIPTQISVSPLKEEKYLFLVSVDTEETVAREQYNKGVSLFMNQTLEDIHRREWSRVWENGRIDLTGNKTLAQITYAAFYYILSSLPLKEDPEYVGLSPGDLGHGTYMKDYQGHVFWDQETWMYPPIQMMHDKIGKALIKTRIRTLDAAKRYAASRGYSGAMFPWESAYSGLDVNPSYETSTYEQHITGDIALAFRQYLLMTNDTEFLTEERGLVAIQEIAKFWASKVTYNSLTDQYEILDVMPPDEYHVIVNNSVYTNVIARISLLLPKFAAGLLNRQADKHFEDIASKLYIPFDGRLKYHPEYDGYLNNITVKQADVVLLGYPLMEDMDIEVRRNDLDFYKKVTPGGPAMTWGMFAIGYLEINDKQSADKYFEKQLGNVVPPFNIWTEVVGGIGAVNFITGMGGYLQSLIFGYGGFRVYPDRLEFDGKLPPSVTTFNITGLDYLGGSIDFSFSATGMTITQTRIASRPLYVLLTSNKSSHTLKVGESQYYSIQRASIKPVSRPNGCVNCSENNASSMDAKLQFHLFVFLFIIQLILITH